MIVETVRNVLFNLSLFSRLFAASNKTEDNKIIAIILISMRRKRLIWRSPFKAALRSSSVLTSIYQKCSFSTIKITQNMVLRELEEMSYRDIAHITDLPLGTVMSRLARGRKRLQLALTNQMTRRS
jgi:hypothetical protein